MAPFLDINRESGNQQLQAGQINNIGLIHLAKGNYEKAMQAFEVAFKIAQGRGDYNGMATRLNNMGLVFLKQENFKDAMEKFSKALKYDKKTKHPIARY